MRRDTRIQHLGADSESALGAVVPPVYRTSLFTFKTSGELQSALRGQSESYLYSRVSNPTVRVLEERIADLEDAEDAVAFASGMGAVSAVLLGLLGRGDHLVIAARAYAPTLHLVGRLEQKFGVEVTRVQPSEIANLKGLLRPTTRLVYMESPSSLTFEVLDLELVSKICSDSGVATVTDNSWATPLYFQPLRLGMDLSLHSGTKYLAGHSDILMGIVAGRGSVIRQVREAATFLGACLSPADAFLAIRGVRTLPLRMERHNQSGGTIARRLLAHPKVAAVNYPALPYSHGHATWRRDFSGASGLFSFVLRGDARRFCDALDLFSLGVSWGGHESLALPVEVTRSVDPESDVRRDLPEGLIRLSVGLEDPEDLWEDLELGFAAC